MQKLKFRLIQTLIFSISLIIANNQLLHNKSYAKGMKNSTKKNIKIFLKIFKNTWQ